MATLGEISVKIRADIGDLERKLSAAEARVTKFETKAEGSAASGVTSIFSKLNTPIVQLEKNTVKTAAGMNMLRGSLTSMAGAALGTAPGVAQLGSALGMMSIGTPLMVGVLAGLSAIAFAWDKITASARAAAKEQEDAHARLMALLKKQQQGALGGIPSDVLSEDKRIKELTAKVANLQALRGSAKGKSSGLIEAEQQLVEAKNAYAAGVTEWKAIDADMRRALEKPIKTPLVRVVKELEEAFGALRAQIDATLTSGVVGGASQGGFFTTAAPLTINEATGRPNAPVPLSTIPMPAEAAAPSGMHILGEKLRVGFDSALASLKEFTTASLPAIAIMKVLSGAMSVLQPAIDALLQPLVMFGEVIGKALVPLLEAFWPVMQQVVIAASYVAQIFMYVSGAIQMAVGWLVEALAKFVDKIIPFGDPLKFLEKFGQGLQDAGRAQIDAANGMSDFRDEIRNLTFEQAQAAEAANNFSGALNNAARGFKIDLRRFQATTGIADPRSAGRAGGVTVHGDIHVHGVQDPKALTAAVERESAAKARRGYTGGLTLGYT